MQVLLIRHAEPVAGVLDAHGRSQARALGERLRWYDCAPSRMWAAPAGIETAELIAAVMTVKPRVEAVDWLADPDATDRIRAAGQADMIAVCADEPLLSSLASRLLGTAIEPLTRACAVRIVDGRLRWRFAWNDAAAEPNRAP